MTPDTTISIAVIVAVITVGMNLYNFVKNRDKNTVQQARWEGSVDTKLDQILESNAKLTVKIEKMDDRQGILENKVDNLSLRVTDLENKPRRTTKKTASLE